jgi:hypothetical protein
MTTGTIKSVTLLLHRQEVLTRSRASAYIVPQQIDPVTNKISPHPHALPLVIPILCLRNVWQYTQLKLLGPPKTARNVRGSGIPVLLYGGRSAKISVHVLADRCSFNGDTGPDKVAP